MALASVLTLAPGAYGDIVVALTCGVVVISILVQRLSIDRRTRHALLQL